MPNKKIPYVIKPPENQKETIGDKMLAFGLMALGSLLTGLIGVAVILALLATAFWILVIK